MYFSLWEVFEAYRQIFRVSLDSCVFQKNKNKMRISRAVRRSVSFPSRNLSNLTGPFSSFYWSGAFSRRRVTDPEVEQADEPGCRAREGASIINLIS